MTLGGETREVHGVLERKARGIPADTRRKRAEIYGTGLVVLGLAVPDQRKLLGHDYSFLNEDARSVLAAWNRVFTESPIFEARSLALIYYESRLKELVPAVCWPTLKKWSAGIDNWEHADRLSKIFARLLEIDPERIYPTLERWNRAKNPWLRRLSIVSLLCYAALRESVPPAARIFPMVERLIHDSDLYVQKGVGWTLREVGQVYPGETKRFVERHAADLAPAAFTSALEKAPKAFREKLKEKRKRQRTAR